MGEPNQGRVMALDLGEKRIGVAVSDETRLLARSYGVVRRKSRRQDFAAYARIIEEQQVGLLVVGLPLMLDGSEGEKARWVRDYAAELERSLEIPLVLWDEALSTVEAEASLRARGVKGKKKRAQVDAVAAAFILQSYLESLR
jgi:putative Holliday junction resolvase